MPTTPQAHSATHSQHRGQYVVEAHLGQWSGTSRAIKSRDTLDRDSEDSPSDAYSEAIRDSKQRARQIMAAINNNDNSLHVSVPHPGSETLENEIRQNGVGLMSRKRSHDGSQLPMSGKRTDDDSPNVSNTGPNEARLDRYMQNEMLHGVVRLEHTERSRALLKSKEAERDFYLNDFKHIRTTQPGAVFGHGYAGYGNRTTEGKTQIVYSTMRGAPKGRRNRDVHVSRKDSAHQADLREELVPVRLDVELDKLRLRDTFTWNLHERMITPEVFADFLLEDLRVPPDYMAEVARQVKAEMSDQILNYFPHIVIEDGPLEPGQSYVDHKDEEMRIQIKLNITIGRITLIDQFEWDINDPQNSPEEFAKQMAWENALSGEFTTAIAHSIREQSQLFTKSLYLTNHGFDGRPIEDSELRDSFLLGPIASPFRPQQMQKDWQPYMYEMSEAELERTETSMMREHRAQKRQLNRRGGPALPDLKDRQRTVRSLFVHSVIPGAVDTFEITGILKTRRNRSSRRPGARTEGEPDSSDLESDDSGVDSPAPSMINAGTARTRGMRGAASAAQAAMRANYGRSQTPDSQMIPTSENRISRRTTLRDDDVVDDESLIVKLKIGKARFKQWLDEYRAKKRASEYPLSGYISQPTALSTPAPSRTATAPVSTPRPSRQTPQPNGSKATPNARAVTVEYDARGGTIMDHWPLSNEEAPPAPPWLVDAITTLRQKHPQSQFEPIMRPYCIDLATGNPVKISLEPGDAAPDDHQLQHLPRIRCNDCPGKLYNAVPDRVLEDFEVHLRNRAHRDRVAERQKRRAAVRS